MLIPTLFSLCVGEVIKDLWLQKAEESVLNTWKSYSQGNHDLQTALQTAFVKTPAALALGLSEQGWRQWMAQQVKRTPPKLSREFAEAMNARYISLFCNGNQELERKLRQIAKAQCKALQSFFSAYPFREVSAQDVANLLYNARFINDAGVLREQRQLTKATLRGRLLEARLDQEFVNFLLFPDDGGGALYDGVLFHFEEEIKSNERVSKILAHFDRQQILAETRRSQQQYEELKQQMAALMQQIGEYTRSENFAQLAEAGNALNTLKPQRDELEALLQRAEQNAQVWQQVDSQLQATRQGFGLISQELSGHFQDLQGWLDSEFEEVKAVVEEEGQQVRNHVSAEANEIMRFVRQELEHFLGARQEAAEVSTQDFLAKPYRLWDRYEKLAETPLGAGGLGEVWKVRDCHLNCTAALKLLLPKHERNAELVARFLAEGKIMGTLGSADMRHFARVLEMGRSAEGFFFIAMEFVNGKPLDALLKEEGPLTPERVLPLLRQLAAALGHAHSQRIIHRDIKPQNIIVHKGRLTLIDFGIAKRLDANSIITDPKFFYGTYKYAAPEQFDEEFGRISERSDIYACGILGYELLTKRFPYSGKTFAHLMRSHCDKPLSDFPEELKIPEKITTLIRKCAQKRQEDRFQSMPEVQAAIDEILQEEAREEYREYFISLLPHIDERKQRLLNKQRKRLGLNLDIIQQIEYELHPKEWTCPMSGIEFVWIPPGRFWMGQTEEEKEWLVENNLWNDWFNNELPRHEVQITVGFWMGKYPVTQEQWLAVMGQNPSYFNEIKVGKGWRRHPVETVSWDDCQEFLRKLNENTPLPPSRGDSSSSLKGGSSSSLSGNSPLEGGRGVFRLPTEAEWEYACRAGTETIWSFGNDEKQLKKYAWYAGNTHKQTYSVGLLAPNTWGLYDIHGNVNECVNEWCEDIYDGDAYKNHSLQNPLVSSDGSDHVFRGGGWRHIPRAVRSAVRLHHTAPSYSGSHLGLRLVRNH